MAVTGVILTSGFLTGLILASPAVPSFPEGLVPDDYCPVTECDCNVQYGILDCSGNVWEDLGQLINDFISGDAEAQELFSGMRVLGLEDTPVQLFPAYDVLTAFLPNLQVIILGDNDLMNCTHVDAYRRRDLSILSTDCPVAGPNELPMSVPAPLLSPPTTTEHYTGNMEEHSTSSGSSMIAAILETFFVKCCFIGFIGLVVGAVCSLAVPLLVRLLYNRIRMRRKTVNERAGGKFQPLLSEPAFITGHPGAGKRILTLNV